MERKSLVRLPCAVCSDARVAQAILCVGLVFTKRMVKLAKEATGEACGAGVRMSQTYQSEMHSANATMNRGQIHFAPPVHCRVHVVAPGRNLAPFRLLDNNGAK